METVRLLTGERAVTAPVLGNFAIFATVAIYTATKRCIVAAATIRADEGLSWSGGDATHNKGHSKDEQ